MTAHDRLPPIPQIDAENATQAAILDLLSIAAPNTKAVIIAALNVERDTYALTGWQEHASDDALLNLHDAFEAVNKAAQDHHNAIQRG